MTKSSYTVTGCCWRLLHWDQSRSGRRNHNANRCINIAYLDNFHIFIRTSFRLCHSRQGRIPDHCLQPLAGMGRRKGQNSEIILIWKFAKPDEDPPASCTAQIIHFCYFTFAKSDKDPIEKVCCDYSLHMAVTHWGPEVEAEMAKVVSPEVKKKFFLVWILALNC